MQRFKVNISEGVSQIVEAENAQEARQKVKAEIESACIEFGNKIKVVELPNITDVFYGRGVGYNIEQLELSKELQEVSATKIRDGQIGQDGKPLGKRPE